MKKFRTKAIVNAPADIVFQTLVDSKNYVRFDKNCRALQGKIELGERIQILAYEKGRDRAFIIVEIQPYESMTWIWQWPLKLLAGKRIFTIIAKDDFTSEFHMCEEINGVLATIFPGFIRDLKDEFSIFSTGLKRYIESRR